MEMTSRRHKVADRMRNRVGRSVEVSLKNPYQEKLFGKVVHVSEIDFELEVDKPPNQPMRISLDRVDWVIDYPDGDPVRFR